MLVCPESRRQSWLDAAVLKAREIASGVLAPSAGQNDKAGRFSTEAVASLGESGLLGLMLPVDVGGLGLGPRAFAAVIATLAEADASVAMVYLMHILGAATISAAQWSSPEYNHCMFTARPDLDPERERRFADALSAMSYDNPVHRPILDAEGLQRWLPPHVDGYAALRQAAAKQGFFERLLAKSA